MTAKTIDVAQLGLSPQSDNGGFLQRVYADGLMKYRRRLRQIGFDDSAGLVLDAGCGFGQWAFAMAELGARVIGIDCSEARIDICRQLAKAWEVREVTFEVGSIEAIPLEAGRLSAVFCYSALYYADLRRAAAEFARVLAPGGRLYICTNGPGRCLFDIIKNPNATPDFSPRLYGLRTLWNSLTGRWYDLSQRSGAHFCWPATVQAELELNGFEIIASGAEGSICVADLPATQRGEPFHQPRFLGLPAVYEILAVKSACEYTGSKRLECLENVHEF